MGTLPGTEDTEINKPESLSWRKSRSMGKTDERSHSLRNDVMCAIWGDSAVEGSQDRGTHHAWWTQGRFLRGVALKYSSYRVM